MLVRLGLNLHRLDHIFFLLLLSLGTWTLKRNGPDIRPGSRYQLSGQRRITILISGRILKKIGPCLILMLWLRSVIQMRSWIILGHPTYLRRDKWSTGQAGGGGSEKKLPHRPPYIAKICLMTMVTFMKYSLNSRPNF